MTKSIDNHLEIAIHHSPDTEYLISTRRGSDVHNVLALVDNIQNRFWHNSQTKHRGYYRSREFLVIGLWLIPRSKRNHNRPLVIGLNYIDQGYRYSFVELESGRIP